MIHPAGLVWPSAAARAMLARASVGPTRLVLDPERARSGAEGFDEGGADPAHRVAHQLAGPGVGGDGVGGDRGQHLRRVRHRLGGVAAGALGAGGVLAGQPYPTSHRHGDGVRGDARRACRRAGLLGARCGDRGCGWVGGGVSVGAHAAAPFSRAGATASPGRTKSVRSTSPRPGPRVVSSGVAVVGDRLLRRLGPRAEGVFDDHDVLQVEQIGVLQRGDDGAGRVDQPATACGGCG